MTGSCLPRKAIFPRPDVSNPLTTSFVYLPPEVLRGGLYLANSDMYSFALLCLEVKDTKCQIFSELRSMESFNVDMFLKISVKSDLENKIKVLMFTPTFSKQKLVACLDENEGARPSAVTLAKEFDNMTRLTRKASTTPGSIFRRATKKVH